MRLEIRPAIQVSDLAHGKYLPVIELFRLLEAGPTQGGQAFVVRHSLEPLNDRRRSLVQKPESSLRPDETAAEKDRNRNVVAFENLLQGEVAAMSIIKGNDQCLRRQLAEISRPPRVDISQ